MFLIFSFCSLSIAVFALTWWKTQGAPAPSLTKPSLTDTSLTDTSELSLQSASSAEPSELSPSEASRTDLSPSLSRELVTELLHAQKNKMQQCQAQNAAAVGRLGVQIEILPTGRVAQLQVQTSSIENLQLQNCALEVLKSTTFPSFTGPRLAISHAVHFE